MHMCVRNAGGTISHRFVNDAFASTVCGPKKRWNNPYAIPHTRQNKMMQDSRKQNWENDAILEMCIMGLKETPKSNQGVEMPAIVFF